MKPILLLMILLIFISALLSRISLFLKSRPLSISPFPITNNKSLTTSSFLPSPTSELTASPPPTGGATPTPRPLTLAEMNAKYGPCAVVPTLMYHHVQDLTEAEAQGHRWLAISPDVFNSQMEHLRNKGYTVIGMGNLADFFNQGTPLPPKPVLLTFDDGYADMVNAISILNQFGYQATMFISTGLMDNPNYLSWNTVQSTPTNILFANHTWSHQNSFAAEVKITDEISKADSQLASRGLGNPKVFAYPYGPSSPIAEKVLSQLGYQLAFTTKPGSIQCNKQRFDLPRLRVGNSALSAYGL